MEEPSCFPRSSTTGATNHRRPRPPRQEVDKSTVSGTVRNVVPEPSMKMAVALPWVTGHLRLVAGHSVKAEKAPRRSAPRRMSFFVCARGRGTCFIHEGACEGRFEKVKDARISLSNSAATKHFHVHSNVFRGNTNYSAEYLYLKREFQGHCPTSKLSKRGALGPRDRPCYISYTACLLAISKP